jgi:predicted permease
LSPEDARREARREFGHIDSLQEQARDARGSRWIESLVADLKFGLRHFSKIPVATATMIVLLALGVGVNTGFFTILHSVRTVPPPAIARNERLVRIRGTTSDSELHEIRNRAFSFPEVRQYAEQTQLFSDVAGSASTGAVLSIRAGESKLPVMANFVTGNFFRVLGVEPILGAGLPAVSAESEAPVAIINYAIWDNQLGRSPDVIGKTIQVNDIVATIVGVAPENFYGASPDNSRWRVWLPVTARAKVAGTASLASYDSTSFAAVALLRPGVRIEQTTSTVQLIAGRAAEQSPARKATSTYSADVVPLLASNDQVKTQSDRIEDLAVLGAITLIGLLILVVTCTNVSTLLVGLAAARRQEIAIRLSLGAARGRLVRQLVTESILLASAGGLLAIGILWTLYRAFGARFPDLPLTLDWTVVSFAFGFAVATGILFGASPALHGTRLAVADVLKNAANSVVVSRSRLHAGLVVAQIACTQPMLVGLGASMLVVLEQYGRSRAPALEQHIVVADFDPGALPLAQAEQELLRLRERFAALPGVVGVVQPPRSGSRRHIVVHPADRPAGVDETGEGFIIRSFSAPPGYFPFFNRPIVHGRDFNDYDVEHGHPIIIGTEAAQRLFGPANPIGRRLARAGQPTGDTSALVVVGVVSDTSYSRPAISDVLVYTPNPEPTQGTVSIASRLLIRTHDPAAPMIPVIRSVAHLEVPNIPLVSAQTMSALEASRRANSLRASGGAAAAGLLVLFLSTIGLYSIVAFAVSQRAREIGIRTALGANRREVVGLFFYRGLKLGLIGLTIGLPLGIVVLRFLSTNFLLPFPKASALSVLIAPLVLAVTALATWIPARRAAGVDPLHALRAE